jgi:hypothetical protein
MREAAGHPALLALARMELKRVAPVVLRTLGLLAMGWVGLLAAGAFTYPRLAFVMAITAGVPVISAPMNALRDKMDGGLEFLRQLPVSAETQAMGRLLALAVLAIPAALLASLAGALALQAELPWIWDARPLVSLFASLALLFVGGGFLLTALVLRFEMHQSSYLPLVFFAVVIIGDSIEERFLPDPVGSFTRMMAHPWFLPVAWVTLVALVALAGWIAFRLACSGIERFTPGRDRMTW